MAEQFRVEPTGLSLAAGRLASSAGDLAGVAVRGELDSAGGAVAGSGTAGQAQRLAGALTQTIEQLAAAVGTMGTVTAASSANYLASDGQAAAMFRSLTVTGSPAAGPTPTATGPALP